VQRIPRELSASRHPTMHRILIESRVRRRETLVLSCGRLRLSTREERREGSETLEGEARCERRVSRPRSLSPSLTRPRGPFVRVNFTPTATLMAISLRWRRWLRDTIAPAARAGHARTRCLSSRCRAPDFCPSTPSQREIAHLIVTSDLLATCDRFGRYSLMSTSCLRRNFVL